MPDRLDFQLLSSGLRRIGWIRFWSQLTLGVVVVVILITQQVGAAWERNSDQIPGVAGAIGVTTMSFFILLYSLWHGWQIVKLGRAVNTEARPSRGEAGRLMKRGIFVDLFGLVLAIVGYEAYAGGLLLQTMRQQPGVAIGASIDNYSINSFEVISLLSNTHVLFAHFIGLILSLWLLQRIYRTT